MRLRLQGPSSLWTRRAVLWVELGAILAWVGLAVQDGRLILSSAIIFSYLILTLAFGSSPKSKVTLQRVVQGERVFEEQSVIAGTAVENASDGPTFVRVSEECPEGLHLVEGGPNYIIFLQPSTRRTINGVLRADFRGHYLLPPPNAVAMDEFGLREIDLEQTGKPTSVSVIPPIEDISDFSLDSRNAQPEIGTFRSGSVGVGTEFFGIREYLPGDELRRINWKASARSQSLLSNEFEREHVTNIYLITDLTSRSLDDLKWTVRASASVATYLLRTRNRLGLIAIGEGISHSRLESGRRQLLRILDKLITAEPGGSGEPSRYLMRLIEEMPPCEVLLISPLTSENVSRTIVEIRSRGKRISVITRAPAQLASAGDPFLTAAIHMHALKRASIIHRLRNAEVGVIEVPIGTTIRAAVSLMKERPVRH
jgi:uncharacterized protein (DUF58 family)